MAWLSQYSRESEGAGHPQDLTSHHCVTLWAKAPKRRRLLVIDLRGLSSWGFTISVSLAWSITDAATATPMVAWATCTDNLMRFYTPPATG